MFKNLILFFAIAAFPLGAFSLKEEMKKDIDVLSHFLSVQYAPIEWKKRHLGWDLGKEVEKAKQKIDQGALPSIQNFQEIVRDFFRSLRDYHTAVQFSNSKAATLPFTVKGCDGRYFIHSIDHERLPYFIYPIEIGDELMAFNQKSMNEVLLEVHERYSSDETENAITELFLTRRFGCLGYQVPDGSIKVAIKSKKAARAITYQLEWEQSDQELTFFEAIPAETFIPILGEKDWEAKDCRAYLFTTETGIKVGYIRLDDYEGGAKEIEDLANILRFFEEQSDALVIDQVNNTGGSFFYMMAIASMLGAPLDLPLEHVVVSEDTVQHALHLLPLLKNVKTDADAQALLGTTIAGYPVTLSLAKSFSAYHQFVVDAWAAGNYLTEPFYVYGIEQIPPHYAIGYTKPIVVLVNELSFSCADFFPAILQDNNRATIMGTKTAGSGGLMREASFPNRFGIESYTYTTSLIERKNRKLLENLGVIPDIVYETTIDDLQNGYRGYKRAILNILDKL